MVKKRIIPGVFVNADSIPEAHYRAVCEVCEKGIDIRTEYDRRDKSGKFIDPPSKDAKGLIVISNPFNQPRYPVISFCERGKYIAEILGAKDHLVLPYEELKEKAGKESLGTEWPYSYHQRLASFPLPDGRIVNQFESMIEILARDGISRRAVATTRLPEIDTKLKEDIPCLGEIQLRVTECEGEKYLHMDTKWRSRDLFRAWPDNVIALTFLQQVLAEKLSEKTGERINVGSYSDYSSSLHIYGQSFTENGVDKYVSVGEDKVVAKAMDSRTAGERLVIPELKDLLNEDTWKFGEPQKELIKKIIEKIKSGEWLA